MIGWNLSIPAFYLSDVVNIFMKNSKVASMDIKELANFAAELADDGAACAVEWFRSDLDIDVKSDSSPVTVADKKTEALLRQKILDRFPDHGILGEEFGKENTQSEYIWSIDPIDGTRSFITGSPLWGTLVALLHEEEPVVGAVNLPVLGESWRAYKEGGCSAASMKGKGVSAQVSGCKNINKAKFYTTSPLYFDPEEKAGLEEIISTVQEPRFGGDCYCYCLLASGYIDLVVESQLHPFDYMPLIPIIREAGGVITDWQGKPAGLNSDGKIVAAATTELHQQTLEILNKGV